MSATGVVAYPRGWWKAGVEKRAVEPVRREVSGHYPIGTRMLTTKEAAQALGVSLWTCLGYIRSGELKAIPKKKGYQVPEPAIYAFRETCAAIRRIR